MIDFWHYIIKTMWMICEDIFQKHQKQSNGVLSNQCVSWQTRFPSRKKPKKRKKTGASRILGKGERWTSWNQQPHLMSAWRSRNQSSRLFGTPEHTMYPVSCIHRRQILKLHPSTLVDVQYDGSKDDLQGFSRQHADYKIAFLSS